MQESKKGTVFLKRFFQNANYFFIKNVTNWYLRGYE